MSFIGLTFVASSKVVEEERKEATSLPTDLESLNSPELDKEEVAPTVIQEAQLGFTEEQSPSNIAAMLLVPWSHKSG